MDQKFIAGIGNIYSDEILFASKIRPMRLAGSLTDAEITKLFQNIKKILKKAIKAKGSSVQNYLDACGKRGNYTKYHKVYHQKKCSSCGEQIRKIKINGRSAHFC